MNTFRARAAAIFPWIGAALVVAAFVIALARVARTRAAESDGRVVVRIAHWQLEHGIRQGIDAAARAYEELHPDVRIEQLLVPERVYPTWMTTRLIGGTAPEIIEIVPNYSAERVARYFRSIGAEVDQPNPYNEGSPLEGVPWRSTFADGLASAYHEELSDYYGVSPFTGTRCLYFNRRLLLEVTGRDEPPADYEGFERVMERLAEFNRERGLSITGYAVHRASATALFNDLSATQFQRLGTELGAAAGTRLPVLREELYLARLAGRWDFSLPEARATLESMREISRTFPPGFAQLGREDAMLAFVQQRALFYFSGTWDATNLAAQADFPVGVTRALVPTASHPRFGAGVLGPLASEDASGSPAFSVTRGTGREERAIDFLRFLTSWRGNTLFSQASGWMPSVDGVPGPEGLAELMTPKGGYPRGPSFLGGADTNLVFSRHLSRLTGPAGSVDAFLAEFEAESLRAMRADLARGLKGTMEGVRRDDPVIVASRVLALAAADGEGGGRDASASAEARRDAHRVEAQNEREAWAAYLALGLGRD